MEFVSYANPKKTRPVGFLVKNLHFAPDLLASLIVTYRTNYAMNDSCRRFCYCFNDISSYLHILMKE